MSGNYYEILEIPSDADEREIKRAYHRLARELHPDKALSPEEAKQLEERFAQISAAYNTLKDGVKRADYDKRNANGGGAKPGSRPTTATAAVLSAGRTVPKAAAPSGGNQSRPAVGVTPEKSSIAQKAFARGMQYYKENNFAKAIEFFDAAIQNNDGEAIYHARLAMALIQAKKSATRAIDAAQRAIELEPYNLEHKFNMAYIFEMIGSKTNAKKIYEDILRWDSGNQRATAALENLKKGKGFYAMMGKSMAKHKSGLLQQILEKFRR